VLTGREASMISLVLGPDPGRSEHAETQTNAVAMATSFPGLPAGLIAER
jgi:hypothetical protein